MRDHRSSVLGALVPDAPAPAALNGAALALRAIVFAAAATMAAIMVTFAVLAP
ncbi:MAG: hypothetical protein ACPGID_03420 [Rubricella sp.]